MRKKGLDLALQELKKKRWVSMICAMTGDRYYAAEEGRRAMKH